MGQEVPVKRDEIITLDHGSGGLKTKELIEGLFLEMLSNPLLDTLEDSAVFNVNGGRVAFTTDSYVVDPIVFPGGDIGALSVHGTINDLAMKGAWPLALSLGLILEEGLEMKVLERVLDSVARASKEAGVMVATGDTKVVPKGKGDKIFINTTGLGAIPGGIDIGVHRVLPGDVIISSGTIGDHGITILTQREGLKFAGDLKSDSQPLHRLVKGLIEELGEDLHCLRDPTRGGVATVLVEVAERAGVPMEIFEDRLPIREEVRATAELLGLDPLYLANEGKLLCWVPERCSDKALEVMRGYEEGKDAAVIGRVVQGDQGRVVLNTIIGGKRAIFALSGTPLPRIC